MVTDTYSATLASLSYSVNAGETGFFIRLSGFNDKLPLLLQTILGHFKDFDKNLEQVEFDAVCDQAKKDYYNMLINPGTLVNQVGNFLKRDVYR